MACTGPRAFSDGVSPGRTPPRTPTRRVTNRPAMTGDRATPLVCRGAKTDGFNITPSVEIPISPPVLLRFFFSFSFHFMILLYTPPRWRRKCVIKTDPVAKKYLLYLVKSITLRTIRTTYVLYIPVYVQGACPDGFLEEGEGVSTVISLHKYLFDAPEPHFYIKRLYPRYIGEHTPQTSLIK